MKYRSLVFVGAALQAGFAHGIGLGDINVQSHLGSPLKANIVLPSSNELDQSDFRINLANQHVYERLGARYEASHGKIRFSVTSDHNSGWYVRVESNQRVNEPFLDIVVELSWAGGTVYRRYNMLLDPPGYFGKSIQPDYVSDELMHSDQNNSPNNVELKSNIPFQDRYALTQNYKVKAGDSLWRIAKNSNVSNMTQLQVMEAIYQNNRNAFVDNDRNKLKLGTNIYLPVESSVNNDQEDQTKNFSKLNIPIIKPSQKPSLSLNLQINDLKRRIEVLENEKQKIMLNKQRLQSEIVLINDIKSQEKGISKDVNDPVSIALVSADTLNTQILGDRLTMLNPKTINPKQWVAQDMIVSNKAIHSIGGREFWFLLGILPLGLMIYFIRKYNRNHEEKLESIADEDLYDVIFGEKRDRSHPDSPEKIINAVDLIREKAIYNEIKMKEKKEEEKISIEDVIQMVELHSMYGQYDQSLNLILPEVIKHPDRKDLRLILMKLYSNMNEWILFDEQMNKVMQAGDIFYIEQAKSLKMQHPKFDCSFDIKKIA